MASLTCGDRDAELQFLAPTGLEREIMERLLDGDIAPLPALREQWRNARIARRDHLWSRALLFAVPPTCSSVWPPDFDLSDVIIEVAGTSDFGTATLEVETGYLYRLDYHLPQAPRRQSAPRPVVCYVNFGTSRSGGDVAVAAGIPRNWQAVRGAFAAADERARYIGLTPP